MNKLIKIIKVFFIICIALIFAVLSYIKFYTAQVSFSEDVTVSIVKTENIQWISNIHRIEREEVPYNWVDEYGFKVLYADEMGHTWEIVHIFIVILWWIMLIYFCLTVWIKNLTSKKLKAIKMNEVNLNRNY